MEALNTQETKKINWKYEFEQYGIALALTLFLFSVFSIYLFFRRGYYDLYIINKVFAGEAAVLLGIVLLIGPLSRFFAFPDRFVQYRKEIGIVAFFLASAHVVVSLFFLPSRFPLDRFIGSLNWPFVFGVAATAVLIVIFLISNDRAMKALSFKKWWPLQYWGIRLAFLFTVLHVLVMKMDGWVSWYVSGGANNLVHPEWPGAGLLVGWFIFFVILVRISEFGGINFGKKVWFFSIIALPLVFVATFWWGGYVMANKAVVPANDNSQDDSQKACTQEAMLCEDGSSVGRTGPNCEFEPCPADKIEQSALGGISGVVLAGPQCPVVRVGQEEECADKPIEITLAVVTNAGKEMARFSSDTEGKFSVEVAPGHYIISSLPGVIFPRCVQDVTVSKNVFSKVEINCDTGIR